MQRKGEPNKSGHLEASNLVSEKNAYMNIVW